MLKIVYTCAVGISRSKKEQTKGSKSSAEPKAKNKIKKTLFLKRLVLLKKKVKVYQRVEKNARNTKKKKKKTSLVKKS